MPDLSKHSHSNVPDEPARTSVPPRLVQAHRWLTRLLVLAVVVAIVVSLVAMPDDSLATGAGWAVVFGLVLGGNVLAVFAAVGFGRYGDLIQGIQNGARPALVTAVGGLCFVLGASSAPASLAVVVVAVLALATAGTTIALRRARKRARVRCPQCGQGWIEQYRVKGTGEVVQVCFACETTWPPDPEMAAAAPNGMPLRLYMAGRGFEPYWEGLDEIRRPA